MREISPNLNLDKAAYRIMNEKCDEKVWLSGRKSKARVIGCVCISPFFSSPFSEV